MKQRMFEHNSELLGANDKEKVWEKSPSLNLSGGGLFFHVFSEFRKKLKRFFDPQNPSNPGSRTLVRLMCLKRNGFPFYGFSEKVFC